MNKIKSIIRNSTVLLGFATIPVLSSSCSQTKEQKYEALKKEINEFNEIPKYKTNIDSFNRIVTSFTQLNNKLKDKITLTTETSAKVNEIKKAINELNQQIGAFESLKHKINESIDNYEDVSNLYSGTLSKLKELNNKIESTEQAVINSVIDEVAKSFKIFTINGDLKTKIVNGVKEIMEKKKVDSNFQKEYLAKIETLCDTYVSEYVRMFKENKKYDFYNNLYLLISGKQEKFINLKSDLSNLNDVEAIKKTIIEFCDLTK